MMESDTFAEHISRLPFVVVTVFENDAHKYLVFFSPHVISITRPTLCTSFPPLCETRQKITGFTTGLPLLRTFLCVCNGLPRLSRDGTGPPLLPLGASLPLSAQMQCRLATFATGVTAWATSKYGGKLLACYELSLS